MICFHNISPFHSILGEIPLFSQGHWEPQCSFLCDAHSWAVLWGLAQATGSPPQHGLFPGQAGGGSSETHTDLFWFRFYWLRMCFLSDERSPHQATEGGGREGGFGASSWDGLCL